MKTIYFIKAVGLSFLWIYITPVNAEFIFKENFNGYNSLNGIDAKMTDANNAPFNNRNITFSKDVGTRLVDLNSVTSYDTTGGLTDARPNPHPKINASDIPTRGGNIADGAMMFKYGAGTNLFVEERFEIDKVALGKEGISDIWVQFDVFVPSNYVDSSSDGNWGSKHFVLYSDGYQNGEDPTVIFGRVTGSFQKNVGMLNGGIQVKDPDTGKWGYTSLNGFDNKYDGPALYNPITDFGKWTRQTFHVKFPTTNNSNNGIVEVWVKHGDGAVLKHANVQAGDFYDNDKNYFNAGYLMGWSNNGFAEDTWFLMTNIIFTDNKENIDLDAITYRARPKPATSVEVNAK